MPTYTSVFATASPLSDIVPNLYSDAVLTAVLKNGSLREHILLAYIRSLPRQIKKYTQYAASSYYDGLPTGKYTGDAPQTAIDAVSTLITAEPASDGLTATAFTNLRYFDGHEIPPPSHYVNWYMFTAYRWSPSVNGNNLYGLTLPNIWSAAPLFEWIDPVAIVDTGTHYVTDIKLLSTNTVSTLNIPKPDWSEGYWMDGYTLGAAPTYSSTWIMAQASNSNPGLVAAELQAASLYYPIVATRVDKDDITSLPVAQDPTGDRAATTVSLLEKLHIDIADVVEGINASPDGDKIDDVFLSFDLDLYRTDSTPINKYNHLWFAYIYGLGTYNTLAQVNFSSAGFADRIYSIAVQEGDFDKKFTFHSFEEDYIPGVLSAEYEKEFVYVAPATHSGFTASNCKIITRHQTTPTHYTQYTACGVSSEDKIYYATYSLDTSTYPPGLVRDKDGYKYFVKQHEAVPADRKGYVYPLHRDLIETLAHKEQNEVLSLGLHINIYAVVQQYVSQWQEFLAFIAPVLGFVLFIFTGGLSIIAAFSVGAVAGIVAIATTFLVTALVNEGLKWLAENIGGVIGVIITVLVAIYIAIRMGKIEGLKSIFQIPTASQLLGMVNVVTNTVQINLEVEQEALEAGYDVLDEYAKEQEELDKKLAEDLTHNNAISDPLLYSREQETMAYISPYETPSQFINRNCHLGNVGVLSLDMVHSYFDNLLSLPTLE